MKTIKRIMTSLLALALMFSMMPTIAMAEAGADYTTKLKIEKRSEDGVDVKWTVKTQNDAALTVTNSIVFKYDNTKYDMVTNSGETISPTSISENLFNTYQNENYTQNVTTLDTPTLWNTSGIYAEPKETWTYVLINLATSNNNAKKKYENETSLAVVHLKLKSGSVADGLPGNSMGIATPEEAKSCAQSGVVIYIGENNTQYIYGNTEGKGDTLLTAPALEVGSGVKFNKLDPTCTAPTELTATYGENLSNVTLNNPEGNTAGEWSWASSTQSVGDVGTKTFKATFTPKDMTTYKTVENIDVSVTVKAKTIADVAIADILDQEYTGSKIEPEITVTGDDGKNLVGDKDYAVTYGTNTTVGNNGGSVTVKAKADGNYTFADVTKNFNIVAMAGNISISGNLNKTYDGSGVATTKLSVNKNNASGSVTYKFYTNEACTEGETIDSPTNAGSYWVKAFMEADTNYGSATSNALKFTISRADIAPTVTLAGWTYGEEAATPSVSENTGNGAVTYAYKVKNAADNTYTGAVPTNAGSYTVRATVAQTTNYNGGSATADFAISAKSIEKVNVAEIAAVTYTGDAHTPTPAVTDDGKTLTSGTDFTYSYANNTDAGTATVTITGKGNYTGTVTKDFTINKAKLTYSVDGAKNIKVGSALSVFTAVAPTTAKGVKGESVTGTVKWYTDSNGSTEAQESDVSGLEVNNTKTLYWRFTPSGTDYNYAEGSVTFTIVEGDPQNISFEKGSVTKTYGDAAFTNAASNKTNDGKAIAEGGAITWTSSDTSVATVGTNGEVNILKIGTVEITATAAEVPGEYAQGSASYELTVSPKAVTITGLTAENKEYDGNTTATVKGNAVLEGLLGVDQSKVSVTAGTASFEDKNAGTGKTVTFTGYSLGGEAAENYTLSAQPASVTADITPKEVSITGVTATDRAYDGTTAITLTSATLSGVVTDDTVSVTGGKGTVESADAGENKEVTVTGYVLTGTDAANYTLAGQPTGIKVTINKAAAVTIANQSVSVKNSNTESQTVDLTKLMPAGAGTLTYTVGSKTDADNIISSWNVSEGVVTFTLSGSVAAEKTATLLVTIGSTNYDNSTVNVMVATVEKDVPELTVGDISKVYDGKALENSAIKGTAKFGENDIKGTWAFKEGSTLTNVADSGAKTVVFTPEDGDSYVAAEKTITVTINKAKPTGTPAYTTISTSGKTLADANLAIGTIKPDTETYTIAWDLPTGTAVVQGTAYAWTFTPSDTANYETLTGTITLWARSTSGGGGGGGYVAPTTAETTAKTFITSNLTAGGKVYAAASADNYKAILAAKDAYAKLSASEQAALDKELKAQTGKTLAELVAEAEAVKEEVEKAAEDEKVTKAEVKATKLKVKSKAVTLNGKKAIKISWSITDGDLEKGDFDGFAIYRSTKKNSGYGKSAYFNTTKFTYTNNKNLKAGRTYYYKIRAYKYIDGVKTFTGYSTKAWRTIK